MRTKALLLTGLLTLAGMVASFAQSNVYSINVVGYTTKNMQPGYNLFCNPLQTTNNTLGALLPTVPDFAQVLTLQPDGTYVTYDFFPGIGWFPDGNLNMDPGKGFWFNNPLGSGSSVTFVGEVLQGALTNQVPAGYSLQGSKVPQEANATTLGVKPGDFDQILLLDYATKLYTTYDNFPGIGWFPSDPVIPVGEAFWYNNASGAGKIDRIFQVQ